MKRRRRLAPRAECWFVVPCALMLSVGMSPSMATAGLPSVDPDCDGLFDPSRDIAAVESALFNGSGCAGADVNLDGRISAPDTAALIQAVGTASTPTPTQTVPAVPTPTASPTAPVSGPEVTFFAVVNPDGCLACDVPNCACAGVPTRTPIFDDEGRRVFRTSRGAGFLLVVEGRPGPSGFQVGTFVPAEIPNSPVRPDLQIQSDRDLGDGSTAICDGGVPRIDPPTFEGAINDALIDFACRFSDLLPNQPCTLDEFGTPAVLTPGGLPSGSRQFCLQVAADEEFPQGETVLLTVRLRDTGGNVGSPVQIVVEVNPP